MGHYPRVRLCNAAREPDEKTTHWPICTSCARCSPARHPVGTLNGPSVATFVPGLPYSVRAGSLGSFIVSVDGAGVVVVDNGTSAIGGSGELTFNTVDVVVDPGDFDGQWHISRGEPATYLSGPTTATLVPDVLFNLRVGGPGGFFITADGDGNVTVPNGVSGFGGSNTLDFNTVDVAVDTAAYSGDWSVTRGEPASYVSGPATATFVRGVTFNLNIGTLHNFALQVLADGTVEVFNGESAEGGVESLTFNTVSVTFDPQAFASPWYLSRATDSVTGPGHSGTRPRGRLQLRRDARRDLPCGGRRPLRRVANEL